MTDVSNTEPTTAELKDAALTAIIDAAVAGDPVAFQAAVEAQLGERTVLRIGDLYGTLEQSVFADANALVT